MTMPTMQQALKLYEEYMQQRCAQSSRFEHGRAKHERIHAAMVAVAAQIIASRIPEIDGEKAYIMGLFHDFGKLTYDDELSDKFHGLEGYKFLSKLGYDELARISLTHTFYEQELNPKEFASYNQSDMRKCRKLIKEVPFDDYDRLIQLCDRLSVGINLNIKQRIINIRNNYRIPALLVKKKYREALMLKKYFDRKCGCDIYKLLGVN